MSLYHSAVGIPAKRKVFVSYHHRGDQAYYDEFSRAFHDSYEAIYDNSLERAVDSDNSEYVMRQIREKYVSGSSCTIVLVGRESWGRKFIDWEISATLDRQHGLLGLQLPSLPIVNNTVNMPSRFEDNVNSGYAVWMRWDYLMMHPHLLATWIEQANAKSKFLINNTRERRLRNV
jgi:hypothetical protein